MRKSLLVVLILAVAVGNLLGADIPITLQVDMTVKTAEDVFKLGVDQVTVRGSFMDEMGYSGDWFPDEGPFVLSDDDQDTIYTITLNMPDSTDTRTYEYKFQINDAIWEGDPNRSFTVQSPSVTVPVDYFDRDDVVTIMCVNFVKFRVDLTSFYGTGLGYFDPSTDSIKIEGFWGDGVAGELSDASARWLIEDVWEPGIYKTQIIVKAEEGKNPEFKSHAFPEDHFENWGWETCSNHSFTIGGDSVAINIDYVPSIVPKLVPLEADLDILFCVNVINAKNRFDGSVVDPATITHVGLKGQNSVLGAWAGDWSLADTTAGLLLMLNDFGINGDKVADDNIWSRTVTFPAGNAGGPSLYKYSVYYPGGENYTDFDNEMLPGNDHYVFIKAGGVTELNDIFGIPSEDGVLADIPVTLQVDMTVKAAEDVFTPGVDQVTLRGSFMDELGCSGDWFPDEGPFVLSDDDQDTIYTITLNMPGATDGITYEYKFQINDAIWEGDPNRSFTVQSPSVTVPVDYFDRDDVVTIMCVNFVKFRVDLTSFYGTGLGYFDPSTDSIKIEGFWGDGVAGELSDASARWLIEDVWEPGIYKTQIIVKAEEGKNPEFKSHAFPEDHFENWGWETCSNHSFTIGGDSVAINIDYVPSIVPKLVPLEADLDILFCVNVINAKNRFDGSVVDPATITHVGLKGQNSVLGAWAGDWSLADTTAGLLLMLNDFGINGDKVADDNIWSRTVTFPAGNAGGPSLYKYSVYYPGGESYTDFDNEMLPGNDHYVFIKIGGVTELNDIFGVPSVDGVPVVSIEENTEISIPKTMKLHQNYPNPFNPTTVISYDLPKTQLVQINIYNMLGQKIANLVNNVQSAGNYSINFDGSSLSSGIYFYQIQTDGFQQTRKMLLVK